MTRLLAARCTPDSPLPLVETVHRPLEGEGAPCLKIAHWLGADHQVAHKVVGDHVHEQLACDHVWRLAA